MSKDNKTEKPKLGFFRSNNVAPRSEKPWEELTIAQKTPVANIMPSKKSPKEEREAGWNNHTAVRGTSTDMLNSGRLLDYVRESLRPSSGPHKRIKPRNERSEPTATQDLAQELEALKIKYRTLKTKYTELKQAYQDASSENNKLQETIRSQNTTIKRQGEQIKVQGDQIVSISRSADKLHSRASTPSKSFRSPSAKEASIISQDELADRLLTAIPSATTYLSETKNLSRGNSFDGSISSKGSSRSRS